MKENDYYQEILKKLSPPNLEELKNEVLKVKDLKGKTKFINSFLKKYGDIKDINKNSQDMILEILKKLISQRKDFEAFIKIYMTSINPIDAKTLKKHFILKNINYSKVKDEEEKADNNNFITFGFNLSCLYDDTIFYHKFVKGMIQYLKMVFDSDFLDRHIQKKFFDNPSESNLYFENISYIEKSLNDILIDMKRYISKESTEKINNNENSKKMEKNKYKLLTIKANKIYLRKEISELYDKCQTNQDILNKLEEMYENKKDDDDLFLLIDFVQELINKETESELIKEKISKYDSEIFFITKEVSDLRTENKELKKEISNLKKENNSMSNKNIKLENKVSALEEKVLFMEPIMNSLICWKVINYSLCQVLDKYKKKIKVEVSKRNENNEPIVYKISFAYSVNNISPENLTHLIDVLFERKIDYNENSHLVGKNIGFLKLDNKDLLAFNAIINDEIKSGFNFGDKDLSVSDYLKTANLDEFVN